MITFALAFCLFMCSAHSAACVSGNAALADAVDSFIQDGAGGVAVATHGPIGDWCFESVTTMSYLFSTIRHNILNISKFNEDISRWNVSGVTNMAAMFSSASAFNQPLASWDVSSVTTMYLMFRAATSFNQPLDSWDVSSVTTMQGMFNSASAFNQPLDSWDVSSVTTVNSMFRGAVSFNQPLSTWNFSSVHAMPAMFRDAVSFNQPLAAWDVSSIATAHYMFSGALSFNQPLDLWNVSSLTYAINMFHRAIAFNQPLSSWDTSSVTTMASMFEEAIAFNQPLSSWDTSSVTSMASMFRNAVAFDQDISIWDVTSVTNMDTMFNSAVAFNQPLTSWNVSSVSSMLLMFSSASSFNQPLSSWDVSSVTNMGGMFTGASAFNQDVCMWGSKLPHRAIVSSMFLSAASCASQNTPNMTSTPPGPFCQACGVRASSTTNSPGVALSVSSNMTVSGNVVITGTLAVLPLSYLVVNGSLSSQIETTLTNSNQITVIGDAYVGGVLNLNLDALPSGPFTILQASTLTGSFSQINVTVPNLKPCEQAIAATPQYLDGTLSTTITVDSSGCTNVNVPLIAGVAGGGLLLGLSAGIIFALVCRKNKIDRQIDRDAREMRIELGRK